MVIKEWISGRVPHYVIYPIHNPMELWKCLNCGVQAFSSLECQEKVLRNADLKKKKKHLNTTMVMLGLLVMIPKNLSCKEVRVPY